MKTIFLGADHAGFKLKEYIKQKLEQKGLNVIDMGTHSEKSVDYPDFAVRVAKAVGRKPEQYRGILVCGTGQGMAITANKVKGVRAAVGYTREIAQLAREHNNANVLCLGSRVTKAREALAIVGQFMNTPFAKERHLRRVRKIQALERNRKKRIIRPRVFRKR